MRSSGAFAVRVAEQGRVLPKVEMTGTGRGSGESVSYYPDVVGDLFQDYYKNDFLVKILPINIAG
uniref:hypothetical protein n=1 Tax=Burkholderia arboris TaxID=488730 RepID=UPI003BEF4AAF